MVDEFSWYGAQSNDPSFKNAIHKEGTDTPTGGNSV